MSSYRSYKFRMYPNEEQKKFLNAQFGAVRFCFNKAIEIWNHWYKVKGKSLSFLGDIQALLPIAKKSRKYSWLKEYDSTSLQVAVQNAGKAAKDFLKGTKGFPRFKSRRDRQSSFHCTSIRLEDGKIRIPKIGLIKIVQHRPVEGELKSITLSRDCCGDYYASMLFKIERDDPEPLKEVEERKVIGIDLGLKDYAVCSNGERIPNPRPLERALKKLRKACKDHSRKKKGSKNKEKSRIRLAKIHRRVTRIRNAFLHNLSRRIVDENQVIVLEKLDIKAMQQNKYLARPISDAAWYEFDRQVKYKAKRVGKIPFVLDKDSPTTQTCSVCGQLNENKLGLWKRSWVCPHCLSRLDRDLNAAVNIKRQGILKLRAEMSAVLLHQ